MSVISRRAKHATALIVQGLSNAAQGHRGYAAAMSVQALPFRALFFNTLFFKTLFFRALFPLLWLAWAITTWPAQATSSFLQR